MSDNLKFRDGRDRAWVSSQPHEQAYAARDWLLANNVRVTPHNISFVMDMIQTFPSHLKSQGRIPRDALIRHLNEVIVVTG